MSDTLLVPIDLDVLLANPALVARDRFRWWKYSYVNLSDDNFQSPEPSGFKSQYLTIKAGAYLHWTLPRSIRSGKEGSSSEFPLVPNRWLIIRIHRDASGNNVQKAWVIESDCPNNGTGGFSFFLVNETVVTGWKNSLEPNRQAAQPVPIGVGNHAYTINIGQTFDQASWKEQAPGPMFLTAVAPGNLEFSAYTPHNDGVFSFYDDLSNVPDTSTLSYFVTGWYSDPLKDIVATGSGSFTGGQTIQDVLTTLNWTIAGKVAPGAIDASLYSGLAFGLDWDKNANSPPTPDQLEDTRSAPNMTVAIANTGVDAFSTLVSTQLAQWPGVATSTVIALLRAFQYDILQLLNQVNGETLLAERIRQEWFGSKAGGTRWIIVADQAGSGITPGATAGNLTPAEQAWLLQLNLDQQALDAALEDLYSLQWDLNAVWWKYGFIKAQILNNTGVDASHLAPFLDSANPHSALSKVINQLGLINGLLNKVPQPIGVAGTNSQEAFSNGIMTFANHKGIEQGKSLKAVAQPRFWKPNNPTIVISGVEPAPLTDPDTSLMVRLSSQAITGFTVTGTPITASAVGNVIPALSNLAALPTAINMLYQEFFLLDPSNAALVAAKTGLAVSAVAGVMTAHAPSTYTGLLPANSLGLWSQKWNPLYIEWEVIHTPVPFEWITNPATGLRTRNWTFNGTDYDLKPGVSGVSNAESLSGRSLLSPHLQFTFGDRLKDFVERYGGTEADLKNLYAEIEQTDNWKFLSQELVNLGEMLTQRDARAFRKPTTETFSAGGARVSFEKVMGYPSDTSQPPYDTPAVGQGLVNSIPAVKSGGASDLSFHGIRSGQFYFNHVIVYDKFGRQLDLIDPAGSGLYDASNFPLVIDSAMQVSHNLTPAVRAPFQLPPRILQPARLDMLLVDQSDDTKALGLAKAVNPVCGWVIANHLDQSLLIYAPDGTGLGEIKLIQGLSANPVAQWSPPLHNPITTIKQITAQSPHLGAFVTALTGKSAAEFQALLGAIDSTLWTTDPLGQRTDQNLSVLIGRPLALVRILLQFSLDGPPLAACDWPTPARPAAVNPNLPDFTTSNFSIRFGDQAARDDGVIGYFTKQDYTQFNSVATPLSGQSYVKEIGPLGGTDGNYINLPFDGQTTEAITLLIDPRAAVHATTGILPVKELTLPAEFIDGPLAQMEITFRMGPLLSRIMPSSTAGGVTPVYTNSLSFLPLTEKNGTWSWWEKTVTNPGTPQATTTWQGFDLDNATTQAALDSTPATLREGYLQFEAKP